MLTILGTGIVVIGVILAGQRSLRAELSSLRADQHELRTSLRAELGELRTELRDRFTVVDTRLTAVERQQGELRERMAHLGGVLDGLREAIVGTRGAA